MKEISNGIFREGREIFTANSVPGSKVYGEQIVKKDREYRHWDPTRSKLAAAILNGLKAEIKSESKILYLGASTGTTPSHLSDIIGSGGIIYAVEFAERVFRSLLELSEKRRNIAPIMADARKPETYGWIEPVDIVYVDLSQPEETEIAIRNADMFLKGSGLLLIAIKSQSIDVTKKPDDVYKTESEKLKRAGFNILQLVDLEPYEEKHAMFIARK